MKCNWKLVNSSVNLTGFGDNNKLVAVALSEIWPKDSDPINIYKLKN